MMFKGIVKMRMTVMALMIMIAMLKLMGMMMVSKLKKQKGIEKSAVVPPQVQESVASCLPPLVPAIKEDAAGIVRNLLQLLLESDKYAERKGAAYGLAGLVKGLGILALKQQDIMTTLTDAIQDKKNFRRREGLSSGRWDSSTAII